MGKIKNNIDTKADNIAKNKGEAGFSYIETIISMVILTVGLLAVLSAMTFALLYGQVAEKKTQAKEIASSIVENIFAVRDIQSQGGLAIDGWEAVQIKQTGNGGIFISGWFPVRAGPGVDGIYGTADDSCQAGGNCTSEPVAEGYERNIAITNIVENGVVRKRLINVNVRYRAIGGVYRQETISKIIANLPLN
jgi:type II secretory pathway pseudopilin PulG